MIILVGAAGLIVGCGIGVFAGVVIRAGSVQPPVMIPKDRASHVRIVPPPRERGA